MITSAKLRANRANARASTGPRTRDGKGRSAQNAKRHGLASPLQDNATYSPRVKALAGEIIAGNVEREAHPNLVGAAHDLALIFVEQQRVADAVRYTYASFNIQDLGKVARPPTFVPSSSDWFAATVAVAATQFFRDFERSFVIEAQQRIDSFRKQLGSFQRYERRLDSRLKKAILRYAEITSRPIIS